MKTIRNYPIILLTYFLLSGYSLGNISTTFSNGNQFVSNLPEIELRYTVSNDGTVSLDARCPNGDSIEQAIIDSWDTPNAGFTTDASAFGESFSIFVTAPGRSLNCTTSYGGGLGVTGNNVSRIDGSGGETVSLRVEAPAHLKLEFQEAGYVNGAGSSSVRAFEFQSGDTVHVSSLPYIAGGTVDLSNSGLSLTNQQILSIRTPTNVSGATGAALASFDFTIVERPPVQLDFASISASGSLDRVRLDFTISNEGYVSVDATAEGASQTIIDAVDQWDSSYVGEMAAESLYGMEFSLIISSSNTKILRLNPGIGFSIQGNNSGRIDGAGIETLQLDATGPVELSLIDLGYSNANQNQASSFVISDANNQFQYALTSNSGTVDLSGSALSLAHNESLTITTPTLNSPAAGAAFASLSFHVMEGMDLQPPSPARFDSPPRQIGGSAISMVAATSYDMSGPVEYKFFETSGNPGGNDSAWQTDPWYSDGGLDPNTTYTYEVVARDAFGFETAPSVAMSATTSAIEPKGDDLTNNLILGVQAWHGATDTAFGHWFRGAPTAENVDLDFFPDMREYQTVYQTQTHYPDGSPVFVYSSEDYDTIDLHVKWMKDYGYNVLQITRHLQIINREGTRRSYDKRVNRFRRACEKYGVKFFISHANNDKTDDGVNIVDNARNDWKHCVDVLKVTESPMYAHQDGLPVIEFWGIGLGNRPLTVDEAHEIFDFYKFVNQPPENEKYKVYLKGGVGQDWRTAGNFQQFDESGNNIGWETVYKRLDMIFPWRGLFTLVGSPGSDNNALNKMQADLVWANANNVDYCPTLSPGASTYYQGLNLNNPDEVNFDPWTEYDPHGSNYRWNWRKRQGGCFIWRQAWELKNHGVQFATVAVWDEMDEGTAMFKLARNLDDLPVGGKQVPLNVDTSLNIAPEDWEAPAHLTDVPSDWYLQLAEQMQMLMDGRLSFESVEREIPPITPSGDVTPPYAPTTVMASETTANSIEVSWESVSDAHEYIVFRRSSLAEPYMPVATVEGALSWEDSNTAAGTPYYYSVAAVDASNNRSYLENEVACMRGRPTDADGDNIADEWEEYYFGSIDVADAYSNSDTDERDDYYEFLMGSNPLIDDGGAFTLSSYHLNEYEVAIEWETVIDRILGIDYSIYIFNDSGNWRTLQPFEYKLSTEQISATRHRLTLILTSDGTDVDPETLEIILTPGDNLAPVASGISVSGIAEEGQTLTGSYTYSDADGDTEGASAFQWYLSADNVFDAGDVAISGATGQSYVLQASDVGSYVFFEVVPVATTGEPVGVAAQSAATGVIKMKDVAGYWSFDEGSGNIAVDSSGNGFDGSIQNGAWVDGSLDFNGANTNVTLPAGVFANISNEITIAMWVYGDPTQPRDDTIFDAVNASGQRVLTIRLPWGNSRVYWYAGNSSGSDRVSKTAPEDTFKNQWNHWVFTKNVSTGVMSIYVNGELFKSRSGKKIPLDEIASATIGSEGSQNYYDGLIREFAIYNVELSEQEVSDLYSQYILTPVTD